jgi:hypothetical protein
MSTDMPDEPISGMDSPTARSPNQETTTSSSSLVAEPPCALVPSSSTQFLDSMALPQSIDKTTIKGMLLDVLIVNSSYRIADQFARIFEFYRFK